MKRFISMALAMVMVITSVFCTVSFVGYADTVIFSDDFAGGTTDYDYTLYDTTVDAEVKATSSGKNDEGEYDVECIEYKGADYEGSVDGGWKVDITNYVTSGMKLGLSFDHLTDYYDAKVFIEVRDGATVADAFDFSDAPKTSEAWASYTSTVQPTISFTSGQKVYLCVKQESGFWHIDNIALSSIGAGGSTGGNTGSDTTTTSVIFSDDFAGGTTDYDYTLYDTTVDAEVKATSSGKNDEGEYDVECIEYKGADYEGSTDGGWKVDITDYVTSGMKLGLSFDHYTEYYDAKAFIEVRNASGAVVNTFDFSDAAKTSAWASYTSTVQPTISFTSGHKVYLCVKQESGFWHVTNIELSSIGSGTGSGNTGSDTTTTSVILSDDFDGGNTDYDYTLYDTTVDATVSATAYGKNDSGEYDVPALQYKGTDYEGSADGGWKLDITSLVTSGMKLGLSFDHLTDYYDAKVFIEVRNASGAVADTFDFSDAPKTSELWASYTSTLQPTISFTSGQKVYLCVKQESGYWFIDNIELSSIGSGTGNNPGTTVILSDDFDGGNTDYDYTLYDTTVDATVSATAYGKNDSGEYDVPALQYKGTDYEGSVDGGWKLDITSLVTSGMKLGLSFDHLTDYYDAKVFIEVRNASGAVVNTFDFSDAPKTSELWASYTSKLQPTISFTSGQKVYLCVKQESGYWFVDNIELSSIGAGGSVPVAPEKIWTTVLNETYDNGTSTNAYTLYDSSVAATIAPTSSGPDSADENYNVECLEYKGENYSGADNGGWKIDITKFVESGDKIKVEFDYKADYYNIDVFVEVRNAAGSVANTYTLGTAALTTPWTSFNSSKEVTVSYSASQTVYLCMKQKSGYWHVDNLKLIKEVESTGIGIVDVKVMNGTTDVTDSVLSNGTIKTTVTLENVSAAPKTAYVMTGVYDGETLVLISAAEEGAITVKAGETEIATTTVSVTNSNYTVKTFIWNVEDGLMDEYTKPVIFDKNGLDCELIQTEVVDLTTVKGMYNDFF